MLIPVALGCGAEPRGDRTASDRPSASDSLAVLPLEVVLADAGTLAGSPAKRSSEPVARIVRVRPAAPAGLDPPLPDPEIAAPEGAEGAEGAPQFLADPGLKPPIPREAAVYALTTRDVPEPPYVELEVFVERDGRVREVVWAGGTRDSLRVAEATACALRMRFFPALLGGEPVPVWCRQRFDYARPQAGR